MDTEFLLGDLEGVVEGFVDVVDGGITEQRLVGDDAVFDLALGAQVFDPRLKVGFATKLAECVVAELVEDVEAGVA